MKTLMIAEYVLCCTIMLFASRGDAEGAPNNEIHMASLDESLIFEVVDHKEPVIQRGDKGTEGNRFGFEGGTVIKRDQAYQMFTSEMVDMPWGTKMRLAHWRSPDGIRWERISTLYESSGDHTGKDPRAAVWAPMPFYNHAEGRWDLFYITYKSEPDNDIAGLNNYEGRVWRAVSQTPGEKGYVGPYKDAGIILQPGSDSDLWEGVQGCDSFYLYEANHRLYGFYGTAHPVTVGRRYWGVGLATATNMAGPWKRCTELNPVNAGTDFVENPIVINLEDGTYLAVFDCGNHGGNGFGYILSKDGQHWSKAHFVSYQPAIPKWYKLARTPLCLIKEDDGTYTTFYTAFTGSGYTGFDRNNGFACVGMARFRLRSASRSAGAIMSK